jgi:hypothetical protein
MKFEMDIPSPFNGGVSKDVVIVETVGGKVQLTTGTRFTEGSYGQAGLSNAKVLLLDEEHARALGWMILFGASE